MDKIKPVLRAWCDNTSSKLPRKLLYLLDGAYSAKKLSSAALVDLDAWELSLLTTFLWKCGFKLGLANVLIDMVGMADDDG